jgi:hypothetical protein
VDIGEGDGDVGEAAVCTDMDIWAGLRMQADRVELSGLIYGVKNVGSWVREK